MQRPKPLTDGEALLIFLLCVGIALTVFLLGLRACLYSPYKP